MQPPKDQISKSYRKAPPAHYTLKIESFLELSEILEKSGVDKYESAVFDVDGYKWKLLMYPYGNKKKSGDGHISLYLALVETDQLLPGNRVDVDLKFFVYDHIQDKYLVIEDGDIKSYYCLKTEHGFDQLLPLTTFNDSRSGYLVDDCCIFGVEVHVLKFAVSKGEKVKIIKEPANGTFTWKIDNFSELEPKDYRSQEFKVGGHKWNLELYPKGNRDQKDRNLSLYLSVDNSSFAQKQVYAEYKLLVKDQTNGKHKEYTVHKWFNDKENSWGFPCFLLLSNLKGFLVNDTLIVEVKIIRLSVAESLC